MERRNKEGVITQERTSMFRRGVVGINETHAEYFAGSYNDF